jgi:hypothetical protein
LLSRDLLRLGMPLLNHSGISRYHDQVYRDFSGSYAQVVG